MRDNCNLTFKQIRELFYPIGTIKIQLDNTNPSKLIGGVWELIEDNTFIASKGLVSSGNYGGSNDSIVVSHSHSATLTGSTTSEGEHTHYLIRANNTGGTDYPQGGINNGGNMTSAMSSTGKHNHAVSVSGDVNSNGEDGTNKNMPKYLACYIFRRTA